MCGKSRGHPEEREGKIHTLVLVNHFLLGSTLACGTSLDWYWAAFVIIPSGFLWGP